MLYVYVTYDVVLYIYFLVCSNYLANYFFSREPINCANKLEKGAHVERIA